MQTTPFVPQFYRSSRKHCCTARSVTVILTPPRALPYVLARWGSHSSLAEDKEVVRNDKTMNPLWVLMNLIVVYRGGETKNT